MKKVLSIVLAITLLALGLTACGGTESDLAYVQGKGTLVVGITDFAPMDYQDADGNYRISVGYLTGIEYYPMESNLHLFLTFVGQTHLFTDRAKALGQSDYSTQRVSVGFIYQLPAF